LTECTKESIPSPWSHDKYSLHLTFLGISIQDLGSINTTSTPGRYCGNIPLLLHDQKFVWKRLEIRGITAGVHKVNMCPQSATGWTVVEDVNFIARGSMISRLKVSRKIESREKIIAKKICVGNINVIGAYFLYWLCAFFYWLLCPCADNQQRGYYYYDQRSPWFVRVQR